MTLPNCHSAEHIDANRHVIVSVVSTLKLSERNMWPRPLAHAYASWQNCHRVTINTLTCGWFSVVDRPI